MFCLGCLRNVFSVITTDLLLASAAVVDVVVVVVVLLVVVSVLVFVVEVAGNIIHFLYSDKLSTIIIS